MERGCSCLDPQVLPAPLSSIKQHLNTIQTIKMKILKALFLLVAFSAATIAANAQQFTQGNDAQTGGGGICYYSPYTGRFVGCVNWWYPTQQFNQDGASQTVIMPGTYNYQFAAAPVTSTYFDTLTTAFTYFKKDSIVGGSVINFNVDQYVTPGSLLAVQLGAASDSSRTIYIKQGSTAIDTVTVTNHKKHTFYVYDGTVLQPAYK